MCDFPETRDVNVCVGMCHLISLTLHALRQVRPVQQWLAIRPNPGLLLTQTQSHHAPQRQAPHSGTEKHPDTSFYIASITRRNIFMVGAHVISLYNSLTLNRTS